MQSQRYVSSVSDLYATDEVELLLEEIRELEPTSCCAEDIQDFEIAGSQTGGGGRSPVGTERSWDSHAHYRRAPPPPPACIAPVYCDLYKLYSLTGFLRLLLVVLSACCLCALWTVVGLRPWLLPLAGRVRALLLAALSSLLAHALLLFLHVSRLAQLFLFDWDKLTVWLCLWSAGAYGCGGVLLLHALLAEPAYAWTPAYVAAPLYTAVGLALGAMCVSLALGAAACRAAGCVLSRRAPSPRSPPHAAQYRALPPLAPAEPQPGSSHDQTNLPL